MSRNLARAAPAPPQAPHRPYFGVEIEIFVRLLPHVENAILDARDQDTRGMEKHWLYWDARLPNNSRDKQRKQAHRECVGGAIKSIIDNTLGPDNGWKCESDASLKEWELKDPDDLYRWWGIEIISPPMYSGKRWQTEIKAIFDVVGASFDFWTNEHCACHVHVSPGPNKDSKYSLTDLTKMAKGAYFWENALRDFLPPARRDNRYAEGNYVHFATDQYFSVPRDTWGGVFGEIDRIAAQGKDNFIYWMTGGATFTRYFSSNFDPVNSYGTVELRRQAGAASALTVIHRVLLALTLHVSWLNCNYTTLARRRDYPDGNELFTELSECIKMLPSTCLGARFQNYMTFCQESYEDNGFFTERDINKQEAKLRAGGDVPTMRRSGGRASSRQSQITLPERPRPRAPAASSAGRSSPASAPRTPARAPRGQSRPAPPPIARHVDAPPPTARTGRAQGGGSSSTRTSRPAREPSRPAAPRARHVPPRDESPPRRPLARTRTTRGGSSSASSSRPLTNRRAEANYDDDEWYRG